MNYKLSELVEISKFKVILDGFYSATGIAVGIVDVDGTVLAASGWRRVCARFHRTNERTVARCRKSHKHIVEQINNGEKFVIYKCGNGLTDLGSPVKIEDSLMAIVCGDQFFLKEPDLDFFRKQAREFGFEEEEYIKEVLDVPIIPEEKIRPIISFFTRFAELITEMGYKHLQQLETMEKLRASEEQIQYLAFYDPLTGLPNRSLFLEKSGAVLAKPMGQRYRGATFFVDMDNFKAVNDTIGHAAGDELLKTAAQKIRASMPEYDIVARWGGDEFIILQPDIGSVEDAAGTADRILEVFRSAWIVGGHEFYLTASIGISIYPEDGNDIHILLRNAETAMYKAKELNKNNYQFYEEQMNTMVLRKVSMENELRHAVENGEFVVFYQPQIDMKTGKMAGMEALVRWLHPLKGIVAPADFIPVAEETGLIVPIGEFVLKTACGQVKSWMEKGCPPLSIAVNISALQFGQKDFVGKVKEILDEVGLEHHYLELEITESTFIGSMDSTVKILNELREMGIKVSLDDFGTGYSSLNYLRRLPIDRIKIDKSFVDDLRNNPQDDVVNGAIILLAQKMKLEVIAEGIETFEQYVFLRDQNCDLAQGYLFSKPLPAHEMEKLLEGDMTFGKVS